jgi:hypothetical protein
MPKLIPDSVKVVETSKPGTRRTWRLFIDGEEFPYGTINIESEDHRAGYKKVHITIIAKEVDLGTYGEQ